MEPIFVDKITVPPDIEDYSNSGSIEDDDIYEEAARAKSGNGSMSRANEESESVQIKQNANSNLVENEMEVRNGELESNKISYKGANTIIIDSKMQAAIDKVLEGNLNKDVQGMDQVYSEDISNDAKIAMDQEMMNTTEGNPEIKIGNGTVTKQGSIRTGDSKSIKDVGDLSMFQIENNQGNPPNTKPLTFAQMVDSNRRPIDSKLKSILRDPNKNHGIVEITVSNLLLGSAPYHTALFGYFIDKKLIFPTIKFYVNRMWKQFGIEDLMVNEEGYYFFHFSTVQGVEPPLLLKESAIQHY
ncbi:hypothetical protein LXL04_015903 [Taraxacum kok-saghyz]